jgi:hypothetical protein
LATGADRVSYSLNCKLLFYCFLYTFITWQTNNEVWRTVKFGWLDIRLTPIENVTESMSESAPGWQRLVLWAAKICNLCSNDRKFFKKICKIKN